MLSHKMVGVVDDSIPSSDIRNKSHFTSEAMAATDLYSDSVDDLETLFCFFDDQDIGQDPKYTIYAPVEE